MKKYIQNTAKLLMSGLLVAVFFISATVGSQAYCTFAVDDLVTAESYDMCINYIEFADATIQPWDFPRDANGVLITRASTYVVENPPWDYDCIRAVNGFNAVNTSHPVPVVERGTKYDMMIMAGRFYLYDDATSVFDEAVTPIANGFVMDVAVFIDWDNNGEFDTDEKAGSINSTGVWADNYILNIDVPSDVTPGIVRVRVVVDYHDDTINNLTACTTTYGEAREYNIEIARSPYDGALAEFVAPTPGVSISEGLQDVIVKLRNDGTVDMTSCAIKWDVNGQESTFNWIGSLIPGATENVTLGNYNFKSMGKVTSYSLSATVSSPNGQPDDMPDNDMISEKYGMPLAPNTYTIGAMKDFTTIARPYGKWCCKSNSYYRCLG